MSTYVDDLFPTPRSEKWPYTQACHLTADTDTELHEMATQLGLKRSWAQKMDHPNQFMHHYDLTPSKRKKAVELGAIEETRTGAAKRILAYAKAMREKAEQSAGDSPADLEAGAA